MVSQKAQAATCLLAKAQVAQAQPSRSGRQTWATVLHVAFFPLEVARQNVPYLHFDSTAYKCHAWTMVFIYQCGRPTGWGQHGVNIVAPLRKWGIHPCVLTV